MRHLTQVNHLLKKHVQKSPHHYVGANSHLVRLNIAPKRLNAHAAIPTGSASATRQSNWRRCQPPRKPTMSANTRRKVASRASSNHHSFLTVLSSASLLISQRVSSSPRL